MHRIRLDSERVRSGLPDKLRAEVDRFVPLEFPAGEGAINWLRDHIEDPCGPWEVVLTLDNERRLVGFFALAYKNVQLEPGTKPVAAMEVAWIARRIDTPKGFGRDLLIYAMTIALSEDAVALVVSPHDDETAVKVWINGFCFRPVPGCKPEGATGQVFVGLRDPDLICATTEAQD
jgi:hypothetical protein